MRFYRKKFANLSKKKKKKKLRCLLRYLLRVKLSLFVITFKMHERTIQSEPKLAEPKW